MSGHIILCADDYALTPGISRAIRMLAAAGRISAASAIVTQPEWPREAEALRPLLGRTAAGLHLNLTHGVPLSPEAMAAFRGKFPGLKRLIALALFRRLDPKVLRAEIERQLDAFEAGLGTTPDFADGHEHVHVLPGIREALIETVTRRYGQPPVLIRDPSPPWPHIAQRKVPGLKAVALRFLARHMRRDIEQAGLISNDIFSGLSDFTASAAAAEREFACAAKLEGWRPLVMCHPGFPDGGTAPRDHISKRRQIEFDVLMRPAPAIGNLWRPVRAADGHVTWSRPALEAMA